MTNTGKKVCFTASIVFLFALTAVFLSSCRNPAGPRPGFIVSFNLNGGNILGQTEIEPVVVRRGEKLENFPDPRRSGFNFAGWFVNPDLEHEWDFENDVVTMDKTLYARWVRAGGGGGGGGGGIMPPPQGDGFISKPGGPYTVVQQLAWVAANANAPEHGNNTTFLVKAHADEVIPATQQIDYGALTGIRVIIRSEPAAPHRTLYLAAGNNIQMFNVGGASGNVTLDLQNIILQGLATSLQPLVQVTENGTLAMNAGSTICSTAPPPIPANPTPAHGRGVRVNGGTLTMTGTSANPVTIRNQWGGGIRLENNAELTMNAHSIISNNRALVGGGVYMSSSSLNMKAGSLISGNQSNMGMGVNVNTGSALTMNTGSVISGNSNLTGIGAYGGAVNLTDNSSVTMNTGSVISGNIATNNLGGSIGGVRVALNSTLIMRGNAAIKDNQSGGGIGLADVEVTGNGRIIMKDTAQISNSSNSQLVLITQGILSMYGANASVTAGINNAGSGIPVRIEGAGRLHMENGKIYATSAGNSINNNGAAEYGNYGDINDPTTWITSLTLGHNSFIAGEITPTGILNAPVRVSGGIRVAP